MTLESPLQKLWLHTFHLASHWQETTEYRCSVGKKTKMHFCLNIKDTLLKVIYICKHNATNKMFSLNLLNTRWSPEIIIIQQIDTLTPDNYFLLISTHINVQQNKFVSITHVSDNPHPTPPARTKLVIMRHYYIDKWNVCQNARLYM